MTDGGRAMESAGGGWTVTRHQRPGRSHPTPLARPELRPLQLADTTSDMTAG